MSNLGLKYKTIIGIGDEILRRINEVYIPAVVILTENSYFAMGNDYEFQLSSTNCSICHYVLWDKGNSQTKCYSCPLRMRDHERKFAGIKKIDYHCIPYSRKTNMLDQAGKYHDLAENIVEKAWNLQNSEFQSKWPSKPRSIFSKNFRDIETKDTIKRIKRRVSWLIKRINKELKSIDAETIHVTWGGY